jgi:hypothetical protein
MLYLISYSTGGTTTYSFTFTNTATHTRTLFCCAHNVHTTYSCALLHAPGACPGPRLCPLFGHIPVELDHFTVDPPLLRGDTSGSTGASKAKSWSLQSGLFAERPAQYNNSGGKSWFVTPMLKKRRFKKEWGRLSSQPRFKRFVALGNKAIGAATTAAGALVTVDSEIAAIGAVLWQHYDVLLSSYVYYVSWGGQTGAYTLII